MVERSKLSKTVTLSPSVQGTAVVTQAQPPDGAASADCPAPVHLVGCGHGAPGPKDHTLLLLWALTPTWCLQWAPAPPSHSQLTPGSNPGVPASKHLPEACALRSRVPMLLTYVVGMLSSRSLTLHFPQMLLLLSL